MGPQPTTLLHSGEGTAAEVPTDRFFVLIFSNTRGSGAGSHVSGVQAKIVASTGRTVEQLRSADLVVTSLHELSPHNFLQVLQTAAKPHPAKLSQNGWRLFMELNSDRPPAIAAVEFRVMKPELTNDQRQALQDSHGCIVGTTYVLMSKDVFCQTMGIVDDKELVASLEAIQEAMTDLEAGRTISLEEAKSRLGAKHGLPS
jgi:hypothetical protein